MAPLSILVTGGGRGLGRATAERLARQGHRVLLTARDAEKAAAAAAAIRAAVPGAAVEPHALDLADTTSIRRLAATIGDAPLDALHHIGGVMQQSHVRRVTKDGFEETLGVNALAPLLLTSLLLPALCASRGAARVILVSSRLHRPGTRGPEVRFDLDDPELTRGYDPDVAYKNSKLAVLWLTYELARRLPPRPITANAICPGFVPVTAAESTRGLTRLLLRYVLPRMPFATSVDTAAGHLADMAASPALDGVSGSYWEDGARASSSPDSRDADRSRRFFDWAVGRVGALGW